MATQRKSLSKKTRFEVFKRDNFTCQYCGQMAPDVVLQVDHISPVKEGGTNDIMNLITSCVDCNSGKGAKKLTDRQEIQKQQEQLKVLSERKEQLEFMLKWREELQSQSEIEIDVAEAEIRKYNNEYSLSEHGRQTLKTLIAKFALPSVLDAISISFTKYDAEKTSESWDVAFNKLGGICNNKQKSASDPISEFRQRAYYAFKKKFTVINEAETRSTIEQIVTDESTLKAFHKIIDASRSKHEFDYNAFEYIVDHSRTKATVM